MGKSTYVIKKSWSGEMDKINDVSVSTLSTPTNYRRRERKEERGEVVQKLSKRLISEIIIIIIIIIIIMNHFSIALFPVKQNELNALNSKCTTDE